MYRYEQKTVQGGRVTVCDKDGNIVARIYNPEGNEMSFCDEACERYEAWLHSIAPAAFPKFDEPKET